MDPLSRSFVSASCKQERARRRRHTRGFGHRVGDRGATEERGHVEPRATGVRTDEAVAGQRGVDEPRVAGLQRGRVEAVALLAVDQQVAEEHVGPIGELAHDLGALRPVERHRDRPLAPVVDVERVVDVGRALRRARQAAHDVTGQRFDLHHIGAHVGEQRAGARSRHPARDLDDAHPVQRSHRADCTAVGGDAIARAVAATMKR